MFYGLPSGVVVKRPAIGHSSHLGSIVLFRDFFTRRNSAFSLSVGAVQTGVDSTLNILQLMVYTAAETNAHQFVRVLFGTSVGRAVFSHYRDSTRLPQDVARDKGHKELAEYLEEMHQR